MCSRLFTTHPTPCTVAGGATALTAGKDMGVTTAMTALAVTTGGTTIVAAATEAAVVPAVITVADGIKPARSRRPGGAPFAGYAG